MHLFFYGTLTHHHANPVTREVLPLLGKGRRASVAASLYAVGTPEGWYPALLDGPGRVHGWLYRAGPEFDSAALARLDLYENYVPRHPRGSEYLRRRMPVRLTKGGTLLAQVYRWNRRVDSAMVHRRKGTSQRGWTRRRTHGLPLRAFMTRGASFIDTNSMIAWL